MPPIVDLTFPNVVQLTSPDTLQGSVYAYDEDGFVALRLRVATDNNTFALDSTVQFVGFPEGTRGLEFQVPAGLPDGTRLTIVATVEDLAGFSTADSSVFLTEISP